MAGVSFDELTPEERLLAELPTGAQLSGTQQGL